MRITDKNKKMKFIVILSIIICGVIYYIYSERNNGMQILSNQIEVTLTESEDNISKNSIQEEESKIIVYVAGEVLNPGVYEMNASDRISDAIDKAGGLNNEANIKNINLAYLLEDGMKIYIPNVSEDSETISEATEGYNTENAGYSYNSSISTSSNNTKVNINTATQTQLETLPGIGPSIALKIINYRTENGKFKNIEDIKNVSGIGESKFSQIKDLILV
jgi:competence protein ComEA